jgi:hypothetical protein
MAMSRSSTVHSDDIPTVEQFIEVGLQDQRELEEELGETRKRLVSTTEALLKKLKEFSIKRSTSFKAWTTGAPKATSLITILALISIALIIKHRNNIHS